MNYPETTPSTRLEAVDGPTTSSPDPKSIPGTEAGTEALSSLDGLWGGIGFVIICLLALIPALTLDPQDGRHLVFLSITCLLWLSLFIGCSVRFWSPSTPMSRGERLFSAFLIILASVGMSLGLLILLANLHLLSPLDTSFGLGFQTFNP